MWFYRMTVLLRVSDLPEEELVSSIIANMDKIHFTDCHNLAKESYHTFRVRVINMFKNPGLSQALMAE